MPQPNKNIVKYQASKYSYVTRNSSGVIIGSGNNLPLGSHEVSRDFLITQSVRTANFDRIPFKLLPINPYYKYSLVMNEPVGIFEQVGTNNSNGQRAELSYSIGLGGLGLSVQDVEPDAEELTQKLISKLIDRIGTERTSSAVTLAELGKTASHLAHTATRIYKSISALKKGRFGDFAKAIGVSYTIRDVKIYNSRFKRSISFDKKRRKNLRKLYVVRNESRVTDLVADTWLEYSYAWKPLLFDVYNTAEACAEVMVEREGVLRYVTVKATSERNTSKSVIQNQIRISDVKRSKRYGAMGVSFRIPDGSVGIANAFGLNNPLAVAWELVPFSFVVDWFLPLGDSISALTAFNGLQFHSGWVSYRHKRDNFRKVSPGPAYDTGSETYIVTKCSLEGSVVEHGHIREVLTDFPKFGWPKLKDPRSFSHAASAIALLQSLFLRK